MKRKKLLATLTDLLGKEERRKRKHHAELNKLLKQLAEKEARLEEKLKTEKDKHKRKRLGKELEIVKAQHAKGLKTLESLELS